MVGLGRVEVADIESSGNDATLREGRRNAVGSFALVSLNVKASFVNLLVGNPQRRKGCGELTVDSQRKTASRFKDIRSQATPALPGIYSVTMHVIAILQALLTPLIAIIATYIAWQQWKGSELKLKLDRYERRLRIYQKVVKMLRTCANGELREFAVIVDFGAVTAEGDFLFGPEIRQYIDEISARAAKLRSAKVQYRDFTQPVPAGYDHEKIVKEMSEQTGWFTEQLVGLVAKNKFGPYLNIS